MSLRDETAVGLRVDSITNLATGDPVKVSETTARCVARALHPDTFIAGYQARLGDEWEERLAEPRQYSVRLRGSEPMESFAAASHADKGEWIVFYGTDGDVLTVIKQAEVISIWREPVRDA